MAIRFVSDVLLHSPTKGTQKLLLIALADKANEHGECWPSNEYLADVCNISPRQVRTLISTLVEEGHLEIVDAGGKGPKHTRRVRVKYSSPLANKEEVQRHKEEVQRQKRRKPTSPDTSVDTSIDTSEKTGANSGSESATPFTLEDARFYFDRKGSTPLQAEAFYDYWETRDFIAVDKKGNPAYITAENWKRRAGTWLKIWRQNQQANRNGKPDRQLLGRRTSDIDYSASL